MGRVEMSSRLGVNCGKGSTIFLLLLSTIYFLAALAYTLTTRLYLHAYYCSAHVSAMAAIIALFVFSHHLLRVRSAFGCTALCFLVFQVVLNFLYLIACMASGVGYTVLATLAHAYNFDHVASAIWAWSAALWLLYLLSLTTIAANPNRHSIATFGPLDAYAPSSMNIKENGNVDFEMKGPQESTPSSVHPPRNCCRKCCLGLTRFIFALFYALTHLLLLVAFFLTAFYPGAVIADILNHRYIQKSYEVQVEGHRPITLYLTCTGSGKETIMYESTVGELASLFVDGIPPVWSSKYKVCAYDRRGVGWSDSVESDFIKHTVNGGLVPTTAARYFRALVTKAEVHVPFFYVGRGYGMRYVLETVTTYPEIVKGAIFLNDTESSDLKLQNILLEVAVNFRATGIVWSALDLGLFNLCDFLHAGNHDNKGATQAFRSGTSLEAFMRELAVNGDPSDLDLGNNGFGIPMLLVEPAGDGSRGSRDPASNTSSFPTTNSTLFYSVPRPRLDGVNQESNDTMITCNLLDAFVEFVGAPGSGIRSVGGAVRLGTGR